MELLNRLDEIVSFIFNNALVVIAIIWVYEGTRVIVMGQQKREGIRKLSLGIFLIVIMIAMQLWVSHTTNKLYQAMTQNTQAELTPDWGNNLDSENREKSSLAYASVAYSRSGKLIHYFDKSGNSKLFCPTEKDVSLRDQTVAVQSQLLNTDSNAYTSAMRWLAFGFIASLAGWIAGNIERKLANKTDAQSN